MLRVGAVALTLAFVQADDFPHQLYDALQKDDVENVVPRFFDADAIYAHTGVPTAKGHYAIIHLLKGFIRRESPAQEAKVLDSQIAGGAQAYIAVRKGFQSVSVRDSIFVTAGKIRAMMTTLASPNDPEVEPRENSNIHFEPNRHEPKLEEEVKKAVTVYFDGFMSLNAEKMQSAYLKDIFYMFDFSPERHVPFGCHSDPGPCSRAKFYTTRDELLPVFKGFASGYVNLNHEYPIVDVYGDMALATSVSLGCEGTHVTPEGQKPMPNREQFVLLKNEGVWKIHSYMFTYDPASPLKPPMTTCPAKATVDTIVV